MPARLAVVCLRSTTVFHPNTLSLAPSKTSLLHVGVCGRFDAGFFLSCGIDLYLIHPPPEASHSPVEPAHIVVAGDSAGGGLSIALLQVIRDSGLPLPAGAVLISPWCDLTHSFPSVHINNATVRVLPSSSECS